VLFGLCALNELFWVLLYLAAYPQTHQWIVIISGRGYNLIELGLWAVAPFCALKHLINLVQLLLACDALVALDAKQVVSNDRASTPKTRRRASPRHTKQA
jgi:hypothetical protein